MIGLPCGEESMLFLSCYVRSVLAGKRQFNIIVRNLKDKIVISGWHELSQR